MNSVGVQWLNHLGMNNQTMLLWKTKGLLYTLILGNQKQTSQKIIEHLFLLIMLGHMQTVSHFEHKPKDTQNVRKNIFAQCPSIMNELLTANWILSSSCLTPSHLPILPLIIIIGGLQYSNQLIFTSSHNNIIIIMLSVYWSVENLYFYSNTRWLQAKSNNNPAKTLS